MMVSWYATTSLARCILALSIVTAIATMGCRDDAYTGAMEQASAPNTSSASVGESSESQPATKQTADTDRLLDKTFDDITFDIEPDEPFEPSMLTPEIEALDGKRIKIRGYILPTARQRGIKKFVLVRDNQECCFGPGAALYDCILVNMNEGKSTEFSTYPVAVEGTFHVEVFKPFDRVMAVFQMNAEEVEQ